MDVSPREGEANEPKLSVPHVSIPRDEKMLKKNIVCILMLALAVRLGALFALGRHISPERWEYDQIALNLLHGKGYLMHWLNTDYRSFVYPVYPFLTALSHLVTGQNYFILELLHIILSVGLCWLVYLTGTTLFEERSGLLASFLTAVHPGLIVYSTKLHELTLVAFLISLIAYVIASRGVGNRANDMMMGLLIGIGALTRPTLIFFIPAVAAHLFLSKKRSREMLNSLFMIVIVSALVILPWTMRNYSVHKRWIFITTNSPEHLWRGNNPVASGTSYTSDGRAIIEAAPKEFTDKLRNSDEIGQYDLFRSEAAKFIQDRGLFSGLFLRKLYYFWWFAPQTGLLYPRAWLIIYELFYAPILLLFICGALFSFRAMDNRKIASMGAILFFICAVSLVHAIYYVEIRHRWAVEPLMMIFAAHAFVKLLDYIKCKRGAGQSTGPLPDSEAPCEI